MKKRSLIRIALLASALALLAFPASSQAFVYWTDFGHGGAGTTIGAVDNNGLLGNPAFITGANEPCMVAVDAGHVYWANQGTNSIGRANLDGSGANPTFITGADRPCGVAVDSSYVYWANSGNGLGTTIGRANLDGTGVDQSFITKTEDPCGVAVDGSHVYWANEGNNSGTTIGRANLNGSGATDSFIGGASAPCGVAVDGAHVYWGNHNTGAIGRANLDGSGINQSFISGASQPCGVAVDGAHVYWGNAGSDSLGRANLDGSGVNQSFWTTGVSFPCGVAVDALTARSSFTTVACSPATVTLPGSTTCTATVAPVARDPGAHPVGNVSFTSNRPGTFGSGGTCTLVAGVGQSSCHVRYTPAFTPSACCGQRITARYAAGLGFDGSTGTGMIAVRFSNHWRIRDIAPLPHRLGFRLIARVRGPGRLAVRGRGIRRRDTVAKHRGRARLLILPTHRTVRRVHRTGAVHLKARITYRPRGGKPNTKTPKLTLKAR